MWGCVKALKLYSLSYFWLCLYLCIHLGKHKEENGHEDGRRRRAHRDHRPAPCRYLLTLGCRIKHYWENWWFSTALLVLHNIHATVIPSLYPLTLLLGKDLPSLAWIAGSWKTRGESEWRRGPAPTIHRVITCICVRIKIQQMTTNYNLLYKRFIFVFL